MAKTQKQHSLWNEKYRPSELDAYVCTPVVRYQMEKYLSKNQIPHLLFYGPTGTGKSTLAKLLVRNLDCDYIYINAGDERGIDTVRDKITNFVSAASFKPLKVVILDDTWKITPDAQGALLNVIEQYSINSRFILTTNHKEALIPALLGRLIQYEILPPAKKDVKIHIATILEQEGVTFEPKDVTVVVNKFYPSIRMCVDNTQNMVKDDTLVLDFEKGGSNTYLNDILELLSAPGKNTWTDIRQIIINQDISDYGEVFRFLYDNAEVYAAKKGYEECILHIAEAQYKQKFCADREINAAAMFINIIRSIK